MSIPIRETNRIVLVLIQHPLILTQLIYTVFNINKQTKSRLDFLNRRKLLKLLLCLFCNWQRIQKFLNLVNIHLALENFIARNQRRILQYAKPEAQGITRPNLTESNPTQVLLAQSLNRWRCIQLISEVEQLGSIIISLLKLFIVIIGNDLHKILHFTRCIDCYSFKLFPTEIFIAYEV